MHVCHENKSLVSRYRRQADHFAFQIGRSADSYKSTTRERERVNDREKTACVGFSWHERVEEGLHLNVKDARQEGVWFHCCSRRLRQARNADAILVCDAWPAETSLHCILLRV
ncbi:hypothetical protein SRHO_G00073700 [Serrasalmus rhombeus]